MQKPPPSFFARHTFIAQIFRATLAAVFLIVSPLFRLSVRGGILARQIPTPVGMSDPTMDDFRAMLLNSKLLDPVEVPNMVQAVKKEEWLRDKLSDIFWKTDLVGDVIPAKERMVGELELEVMWLDLQKEWKRRKFSQ